MNSWICCQIGAREHYAIPRALQYNQQLQLLITDIWLPKKSLLNLLPKPLCTNFRQRYHPQLNTALVKSFNYQSIDREFIYQQKRIKGWNKIIERNSWWQQQVIKKLDRAKLPDGKMVLFAYSYAALELFQYAKKRGWYTVLGQIDPGVVEEKLVYKIAQKRSALQPKFNLAPWQYWSDWRQECTIADHIIVNSDWSSQAIQQTGISADKISTIPLAYQPLATKISRSYPDRFTSQRPLKVLFLGQIVIRKGILEILEAIALLNSYLNSALIEFWFVGQRQINIPKQYKRHPQIKWLGSVSRSQTSQYYQQADVFLFPTHSDGFGLTQLEAQAWQLPIIASKFCGAVVKDRINGLILRQVTAQDIAKAIIFCANNPQELVKYSDNCCRLSSNFSLENLATKINNISPQINKNKIAL